ncbi:MAG: NAD(P)-binding protein [Streptosporangiales bacterium]|nr:NAD(P)-binding protein [Streptosporangiales bacterium]
MPEILVLVVGAGPVGLTLACGLAQQGVAVRVVDKAAGPATTSRANILHGRGVEVLDRVGALGDLPQRAASGFTMRPVMGGRVFTIRFGDVDGTPVRALYISQAEVESELRRRLAELGTAVEWGVELTDARPDAAGVDAVLASGESVRARWLVGCDGGDSAVRALAGFEFPGAAISEKFLLADLHVEDWDFDRDGGVGWYHEDGMLVAMPMPEPDGARDRGDLWRFMAYLPEGTRERLTDAQVVDSFRRIVPRRSGVSGVRVRDAAWTSVFRIQRRLVDDYRRGRVLLAGDAAHLHSPFGGQGMLTGVGDAENLAWKLALVVYGRAHEALLDTYAAERRPVAATVLKETGRGTWLQTSDSAMARALVRRVVAPLLSRPSVQRRLTLAASQLGVTYRAGPLGSRRGGRPYPGDRIPDLGCRAADGRATRLHAELRGRWALLTAATGVSECLAAARERLGQCVTALVPAARPGDEVWLVRPDGHLAWRGPSEPRALARWLDGTLQRGRAGR